LHGILIENGREISSLLEFGIKRNIFKMMLKKPGKIQRGRQKSGRIISNGPCIISRRFMVTRIQDLLFPGRIFTRTGENE